jgi:hypothetical protein
LLTSPRKYPAFLLSVFIVNVKWRIKFLVMDLEETEARNGSAGEGQLQFD